MSENTFAPKTAMNHGVLATVLYNLSGKTEYGLNSGKFPDTNDWYKNAIDWAAAIGAGNDETDDFSQFPDSTKVNSYAKEAMGWAVANGLITGRANGTLDPRGTATCAEVATVLVGFVEYLK